MSYLTTFGSNPDPVTVRKLLDAYYRMRDAADEASAELRATGAPLAERIAMRSVRHEIDDAITWANRFLSRVARRGGRGIPASPAPKSVGGKQGNPGCRGGTPAVKGHGCPVLVPAVGPAPAVSTGHATASPVDPLLLGLLVQELPVAGLSRPADIISNEGVNS